MPTKTFVLAGTIRQYHDFLRDHHYSPMQYEYLQDRSQLLGQHPALIERIGTWYTKPETLLHAAEMAELWD